VTTKPATALAFLFAIEADGRAFGEPAGGQYRAVEVQGDTGQAQGSELIQNPLPDKPAQVGDTGCIQRRQRPADGSDIRQALQTQQAMHHGVIRIMSFTADPAILAMPLPLPCQACTVQASRFLQRGTTHVHSPWAALKLIIFRCPGRVVIDKSQYAIMRGNSPAT